MINKKILMLDSKIFILIFLYPFLSIVLTGTNYKIASEATLERGIDIDIVRSNIPEIIVTYKDIDIELKNYWEIGENGEVFLVYQIEKRNFKGLRELLFYTDFEEKFDIQLKKSYWKNNNSNKREYFNENGRLENSEKNIELKKENGIFQFKGKIEEGILVLSLNPDYINFKGEIYKGKTPYSYKNDKEHSINKVTYAPNFYFLTSKDLEVKILRYQTLDTNKDNKIDFPYQLGELEAKVGDIIFYKVEITNNTLQTIYNLNITNPIGEHSKLSFGDKLLTGTGYPVVELEEGKFVEITNYPNTARGGKLDFFLEKLSSNESINIYYCVEIIK